MPSRYDIPWNDSRSCMDLTMKQIKAHDRYKYLTPLGKPNESGSYHHGRKSTMRKAELCKALENPKAYHKSNKRVVHGDRIRVTRAGFCNPKTRKYSKTRGCSNPGWPHKGYTSTGRLCCYKRPQSAKTLAKNLKARKERKKREKVLEKKLKPKSTKRLKNMYALSTSAAEKKLIKKILKAKQLSRYRRQGRAMRNLFRT